MNIKRILGVAAIAAVVLLTGLTGCATMDLQELQGILKNIDSLSGNVTVTLSDNTTRTFNLADVDLEALKDKLGNVSIDIGDNITIKQDPNGRIRKMETHFSEADGIIKSVTGGNVTITTENDGDITLKVTDNTLVIRKATGTIALADLQAGQRVEARYDAATMQAIKLKIEYINYGNHGESYSKLEGTIKSVSANNTSVIITDEEQGEITIKVTTATIITLDKQGPAVFADLKAGQEVMVKYDPSTMQALRIAVADEDEDKGEKNRNRMQVKNQERENNGKHGK